MSPGRRPSIVLLCHRDDPIDARGLAAWLASSFCLSGIVVVSGSYRRRWRALRAERRRSGWIGLADVFAFRAFYALTLAGRDRAWMTRAVERLEAIYGPVGASVPRIEVESPNDAATGRFLRALAPDLAIARCRELLRRDVYTVPRAGTIVLHPGICPEYRNAHGCFWALARRDLDRVGMTLLRIDDGIDTGAIFLQAGCDVDEVHESHAVIQYRVVIENLDAIERTLVAIANGRTVALDVAHRQSAVWGQPRLSAHLAWKRAARRAARDSSHLAPAP